MATLAFGLAVLFRLYQEVWSNALVVAGFYGDEVQTLHKCFFCLLLFFGWSIANSKQRAASPFMLFSWPAYMDVALTLTFVLTHCSIMITVYSDLTLNRHRLHAR